MYAVGKLGSYISRGVVTVAAPFHPFGGAVDIVVVEQEDGSFKSSPWYVQFGKFQGVLKAREKVVSINVNGLDADFSMYLDSRGGAYFLREADEGEADSGSWGASPDSISSMRRPKKIMSCNYDLQRTKMVSEFEAGNAKVTRSSSSGPRILGFVFGGRSEDENAVQQRDDVIGRDRGGSLERAEMAADLLEVKWSTSLATRKQKNGSDSLNSDQHLSVNGDIQTSPSAYTDTGSQTDYSMTPDSNGFGNNSFRSVSTDGGDTETSPSTDPENFMESFTLKEKYFGVNGASNGGSKASSAATLDDVPTVLETEVEVILDSKTDEGPVKYVTKMVVDQVSTNQDPSLTNSLLIEEATSAAFDLMENLRSEKQCSSPSNSTYPGSCEKHGSLVINVTRNKHEPNNCGECNDQKVAGLPEKDDEGHEAQFFFSDLESLEQKIALTVDREATALDSLEAEKNPEHSFTGEESDGSTEMVKKSHSYTEELLEEALPNDHPCSPKISRTTSSPISIATDREQVDHIAPIDAFSSSWSHGVDTNPQDVNHPISRSLDSSFDNMMLVQGDVPMTSENGTQEQQTTPRKSSLEQYQISEKLKELLSDPAVEISLCRHSVHEGMGYEAATHAFDSEKVDVEKFISLGPDVIKNDKVVVRIGGLYFPWDAALPIVSAIGAPRGEQILEPKGMIRVEQVENAVESNPQQSMDASNGTWRLWPFKKTMSRRNSVVVDATPRYPAGNTDTPKSNNFRSDTFKSETIKKNVVRKKTPTSDQLESLNLKQGRNEVIFTFSTPMLGEQKVDARIYLWKWNARIVISDVDGTITKSDVLGQFMPMVGVDWSQTGVTHLFSAIKENGYELLFLSARAISQASLTRQFLFNLKQDGVALPEGPVVISPDGLFPSLFREVIRRAPHEFKIACLEDIKALFPLDQNPFYAGFGNRDTDELSYVKVGIPKGKVFIINPKGEVAVHRRVDTKSYTSLHDLVHEMFPHPTSVPPTEKEDYNTWNFWRLPPPDIL